MDNVGRKGTACPVIDGVTGKILFMVDCETLNKGDYIKKNNGDAYVIIRKDYNMSILAVEYMVEWSSSLVG